MIELVYDDFRSLAGKYLAGETQSNTLQPTAVVHEAFIKLIDQQDLIDQGFRSSYNTPEWRTNLSFSNREVIDNLGFNITWRWQDAFFWEASFGAGVIPAFSTVDAQVSYKVPSIKSIFKLGAQNLLDEKYTTGFGNPTMGAMYYLSITFDQFLN